MQKKKAARLGGFIGALCATGALVGFSVSGTGAYFTDSHAGVINSSTGGVHVNTSDLTLNYTNLLPGQDKTNEIDYTASGTGPEDIWLVLPTDGSAVEFNGPGGSNATPSALGRYGHFAVSAPAGSFNSYNLSSNPDGSSNASCSVDANGHGGSGQQATSTNKSDPGSYVPYCAVPNAILLQSGLTYGQSGSAQVTFGYTKILRSAAAEDQGLGQVAKFSLVATQAGIAPNDPNNPGN